jgi:cell division GTPase FtsZ
MSAKTITEDNELENVNDDVSHVEVEQPKEELNKLAALRAKSQAKQQEMKMAAKIVAKKERSLRLGFLGTGQAGSRIVEAAYNSGYDAVVCNTATQDLKFISIPDSNKLLLDYSLGGAAKELSIGHAAAEANKDLISELVAEKLQDSQVNVLCLSLGGGSGAGSAEVMIDVLSEVGKPIVVIAALPMDTDDTKAKSNSLETLAKLAKAAQTKRISNLIVVDNAKLESVLSNVSQMNFFEVANKAIIEPLDVFNTFSAMPSSMKGLDSMEFSKLLIDGEGLTIYGELTVNNYEEDTAIAEAVINNLSGNLLASDFDLKQAKYAGVIVTASKEVWARIPSSSINYAMSMITDFCGQPSGIFKGLYVTDSTEDVVKVYSMFSGLSLPELRIDQLKKEVKAHSETIKTKDVQRNLNMSVDTGANETVSAAQKVKDQIAQKNSAFGKLLGKNVVDRRK